MKKQDHIRHATTDGVFAKLANDIAMTQWKAEQVGEAEPKREWTGTTMDIDFYPILVQLVVGLSGMTEVEVRKRLSTEILKYRSDIDRMAAAMRESMEA